MISVIVPIYKAEKCLHRCVDSILSQKYTDFELLLIDDGSPDGSGAICEAYAIKDSRVRVYHKKNGGVSSARNIGLNHAKGEYVVFCDADDYVDPSWLSVFTKAIENNTDFIAQGYYRIIANKPIEEICPNSMDSGDLKLVIKELVMSSCFGFSPLKAFRRNLIEEHNIRFDELSSYTEDAQFIVDYLVHARSFRIVNEAHYYYYIDENKEYNGDAYYSILRVCHSLKNIFNGSLPNEFCERYFGYIKNGAIDYIIQRKKLEDFHIALYKNMIIVLGLNIGMKNRIRNFLILESGRLGTLSVWGLKLVKKLSR